MKQSLTSQMIDGVFPPGPAPDLNKLVKRDIPLKCCYQCFRLWPNAQKFCHECGFQFYGVKNV